MKQIITSFLSLLFLAAKAQHAWLLLGTYDSPISQGIYVYKFNIADGSADSISMVKAANPSFLAVSPDKKHVVSVSENAGDPKPGGKIISWQFDKKTGKLSPWSIQSTNGNNPCHVSFDASGSWVIAGNYSSGNLSVHPFLYTNKKKGIKAISAAIQTINHTGSGPDTNRQKSPHVHGIFFRPGTNQVFVTDLGIDKVMVYTQNKKTGKLMLPATKKIEMDPGSGPRHLDFHPGGKYIYVLNELTNSVSVLKDSSNGRFAEIQTHSVLPLYFRGKATSADIHVSPDGKFLYASVRGTANSIAIFSIDKTTGWLTLAGHQYTEGETPRNFNFDPTGKYLLVANQNSNSIVVFSRNSETGLLTDTGKRIHIGKPVCIKWISIN